MLDAAASYNVKAMRQALLERTQPPIVTRVSPAIGYAVRVIGLPRGAWARRATWPAYPLEKPRFAPVQQGGAAA